MNAGTSGLCTIEELFAVTDIVLVQGLTGGAHSGGLPARHRRDTRGNKQQAEQDSPGPSRERYGNGKVPSLMSFISCYILKLIWRYMSCKHGRRIVMLLSKEACELPAFILKMFLSIPRRPKIILYRVMNGALNVCTLPMKITLGKCHRRFILH